MTNRHAVFFLASPMLCLALAFMAGVAMRLAPQLAWLYAALFALLWLAATQSAHPLRWSIALPVCLALGFLRMHCAQNPSGRHYRNLLPRQRCSAVMHLMVQEAPLQEEELAEWESGRGLILAEVRAIQLVADPEPQPATGRIALRAVYEMRDSLRTLQPGDGVVAQGILLPLDDNEPLDEIFLAQLRSRGLFHQFEIDALEPLELSPPSLIMRLRLRLRRLRAMAAARLVRNVQTKPAAQELLALGLGLSEFLPRDSRQRQVVSGTVHVFAISGMHLGMVALLLTVLLRWSALPLGLQRLLLALFSAGYALLTGASVSSLRALWMVWLGLYATSRHRRTSWLNALGCAAFFALAIQPWQVLDMGFLYSHLTVLVLLLGAPMMQRLAALLGERDAWLPRTMRQRRRLALLKWLATGLAVSLLAWLGSLGMTLHHNARISYGAPLLNLPLGILVATTLALCPLRLLLGALFPAADGFWASALETMMQLTAAFAESGADSAFAFDHPLLPLWAVILYYLLFFPCLIWLYLHFQKESE